MRIYQRKIIYIYLVVILFVSSTPVSAQTTFGNKDCGEWIRSPTDVKRQWLIGYMSGLSLMHALNGRKDDPLNKINSADQIYLWMDNYCKKNPLSKIDLGGVDLFMELIRN